MNNERILIECANLTSSAAPKHSSDGSEKDTDELRLIANTALTKSWKSKEITSVNGDVPRRVKHKSDDTSDDGVFEDADDDKTAAHSLDPVKISPKHGTKDSHRIIHTEDLLIAYAHLSDSELSVCSREHVHEEITKAKTKAKGIGEEYLGIPRLDIDHVSDDNSYESEKDGYKTPANSEQGDNPPLNTALHRRHETEAAQERSSAERFRIVYDDDADTDGDFNALVTDTANAMNAFEFDDIKTLFQGVEGFEIFIDQDSPILFLNHMRRYKIISPENLQHLQTIVTRLGNPLLHLRARQLMKQKAQTVHFYPETRHIPLGFGTFKCHITGKDFTRLKRNDLETIRSTLSLLLFIPTYNIYVIGIEPGINLVISMMIPTRYIGALKKMAADGLPELGSAGVDLIQISARTFKTHGVKSHTASGNEHMKFLTVYQQLREKNLQLEERDREIAKLKSNAEFMRLELETKTAELGVLTERSPRDPFRRHHSAERARQPVRRRGNLPTIHTNKESKPDTAVDTQSANIKIVVSDADADSSAEHRRGERTRTGEIEHERRSRSKERRHRRSGSRESRERHDMHTFTDPLLGFHWTRGDISQLSDVRHVLERGEIMSEIESILSELGVPSY